MSAEERQKVWWIPQVPFKSVQVEFDVAMLQGMLGMQALAKFHVAVYTSL